MGVCAQQHRVCTGRYNSIYYKMCANNLHDDMSVSKALTMSISVVGLIFYMYIICLLMALSMKISLNCQESLITMPRHFQTAQNYNNMDLVNGCFLALIFWIVKNTNIGRHKNRAMQHCNPVFNIGSRKDYVLTKPMLFTYWVAAVNLILIIIGNPAIVNPGPFQNKHKVSVLYHNIRGFIPPTELGKPNPSLNTIKISEFQSYLFEKKNRHCGFK